VGVLRSFTRVGWGGVKFAYPQGVGGAWLYPDYSVETARANCMQSSGHCKTGAHLKDEVEPRIFSQAVDEHKDSLHTVRCLEGQAGVGARIPHSHTSMQSRQHLVGIPPALPGLC